MLSRLPKSGDVWPEADRKLWLQLLEGSFKLIYKDKSDKEARAQSTHDALMERHLEERLKTKTVHSWRRRAFGNDKAAN